ncbi:endonuclease [Parabacteroides sp. OttesenSCG-928-G07]|nr:endonuclease [Parabacteroides sp. OttesenSCG-928-G21]MDL2278808.1 endonuclease [Parabacteroides sp. OttesenSCG-928-G07]
MAFMVGFSSCSGTSSPDNLRVLFWNIQNGMWSGQDDNYDAFVEWVSEQQPDICIWCEAQSIYLSGTADAMPREDRYLVDNWDELAARYGHTYCYVGGHRDNYPQVITSKYPIENIARITDAEPDSIVSHGAGWARVNVNGQALNLVSLHLWPLRYTYGATDREASIAENGGDRYRRMEMEYICNQTIKSVSGAEEQMWFMAGDFNARSRRDNWFYKYPEDDTRLLVHDYIQQNTPYIDIIADKYPNEFKTTTYGESRIDFVYCTRPLYDRIVQAEVLLDEYTTPVRDPKGLSNFWNPSDHLPILVEFKMGK